MSADWIPLLLSALFGGAVSSAGWLVSNAVRLGRLEAVVDGIAKQLERADHERFLLSEKVDRLIERTL